MKKLALLVVVASLFVASPVMAVKSFKSGNALSENCTSNISVEESYCLGYIAASDDAHSVLVGNDFMNPLFCTPNGVTVGQLKKLLSNI